MLGFRRIHEYNFSKLNHKVPKSVNFWSSYIRHILWSKKGNSTFQSRIITSRALIASRHSQCPLRSRKKRIQFFEVEIQCLSTLSRAWDMSALYPAEKPKEQFNFLKLNNNVQSIYFRARAFITSRHPQWLLRSKKMNSTFRSWNSKSWSQ